MDRPMGPRQPPDKRNAAYEAIFQRPGAAHHVPTQSYPHLQLPPQQPYQQQHFQQPPDRRTSINSYTSAYSSTAYLHPQQPPPGNFRQPYYPTPPHLAQHMQQAPYDHQLPAQYAYPPPNPNRARSLISNSHSPGIIAQPPDKPPEANPQGLTPAQAYQFQVYMNSTSSPPQERNRYQTPPVPADRNSFPQYQNGSPHRLQEPPRLGINLEADDGHLGIDFTASTSNASDQGIEDDTTSELPWARPDRAAYDQRSLISHRPNSDASNTLVVDTYSARTSMISASPVSSAAETSITHPGDQSHYTSRRSSDSIRTMPKLAGARRERSAQERSMSMSSATPPLRNEQKRSSRPSLPVTEGRDSPISAPRRKTPIVYPALLSRVADAFRERIPLGDRVKDGLTYKDAFDGREAVDKIAYIIKTTDRNLALLLGRALDAQKFFHDVTYDHRLRDSPNELYQFQTVLGPYVSGELTGTPDHDDATSTLSPTHSTPQGDEDTPTTEEISLPSGVFTLLTDCYSPTCSRDQLCYSIACPRRLEQQARLNMKPQPGLSKEISRESLYDIPEDGTLWIHSVPAEIVASVSDTEKKRQEAINEVIYTERDFVRDLEYLRDFWMIRLQTEDIIAPDRRKDFVTQVFWNVLDILEINRKLRDALSKRQKSYAVVDRIGDIFMEYVPHFQPFVAYGAHQLYGKYEFEREKSQNPLFAQFVEITERLPESRKLELNAFLTKPTTRLARYPLLLETVLKHTPHDSSDKTVIPKVVAMIKSLLDNVNVETGKTENRFNLTQLEQQLHFKPGDEVELRLNEPGREMLYKGGLQKRDGEIYVYLFDHAILFTKASKNKQHELRVYKRPIPLELLSISTSEDTSGTNSNNGTVRSRKQTGLVKKTSFNREHRSSGTIVPAVNVRPELKGQFWISFSLQGRHHYKMVLWANSALIQKKWVDAILRQQKLIRERSSIFETFTLSDGFFSGPIKVNCAAPFSGGRRIVYGTDDGVYISDLREKGREPTKVLALLEVSQVDVLEDYQLLIVLSERQVITFPLDALDPIDPMAGLKRAKRISSHTSFFKSGYCLGKMLVCIVKSSQLSSTFKALEPIESDIRGNKKPTFKKLLQGGNDTLKPFKEFYIPVESTSIHYLKTKMCVGCSRGFEIVDLHTLDTQGLLDPADGSLDFVRSKAQLRPMALYRIQNEFLLCYDAFAFYVNKSGQRSRPNFMVSWEGQPTGFALHDPFILAFEPSFIEIRRVGDGSLAQIIPGSNLRLLFADTPPVSQSMGQNMQGNAYGQVPGIYSPHQGYPRQGQSPHVGGRDEILVCSDDHVFALRPATSGPGMHHWQLNPIGPPRTSPHIQR